MNCINLSQLYDYLDQLALNDADADVLFASSYIRGFVALIAANFGDDSQLLTRELAAQIEYSLQQAKTELTPQDRAIVNNYWLELLPVFSH